MEMNTDKYIGMMLDDRYEILSLIGNGGMANVYKAMCHKLKRYDAVKIMRDDTAANENFKKYFRAESQAVAKLSHPNIVSVYDVGQSGEIEYIVMELVDGITLKEHMQEHGVLDHVQALDFSTQIARALSHAHSKGVIHRDIKPQNVMLLKDGLIKVADFGIAALSNSFEEDPDETIGSVYYIAPEQARGAAPDARSDVYSLGIVMYEMLTGKLPYVGKTDLEVAVKHMNTEAVRPRDIVPTIPEELERICLKAMASDINERYQSADELLNDLERYSGKETKERTMMSSGFDSTEPTDKKSRSRKKKDHTVSSGIIAVLVLIILVFAFVIVYFARDFFKDPVTIEVQNFIGRYYEDVINDSDLEGEYRFTVTFKVDPEHEYGIIIDQSPGENEVRQLKNSDDRAEVELTISSGEAIGDITKEYVDVPDVVNREQSSAIARIKAAGFNYAVYEAPSSSITKGYVISTEPAAGESVLNGSEVVITVSSGPETESIQVPKLIGLSKNAALEKLEAANLSLDEIEVIESDYDEGTVIWQSREPGQIVEEHTKISIQISAGPAEDGN